MAHFKYRCGYMLLIVNQGSFASSGTIREGAGQLTIAQSGGYGKRQGTIDGAGWCGVV